jgi:hypothetical protein
LLAAIDQFDALEKNRVAAVGSSKAPATTVASHKVAHAAAPA